MMEWKEQFRTGSDTIDRQHMALIQNINYLECLLTETNTTKETCDFLVHLIDFLETYAQEHFRFEEDCMTRHQCPAHAINKEAHEAFMAFLEQYKEETRHKGFHLDIVRALHQTMSLWIEEHILRVDIQLKPCLKIGN